MTIEYGSCVVGVWLCKLRIVVMSGLDAHRLCTGQLLVHRVRHSRMPHVSPSGACGKGRVDESQWLLANNW